MTNNSQHNEDFDPDSARRSPPVRVELVYTGSPEYKAAMAREQQAQSERESDLAAQLPALNRALVALGEAGLDVSAPADAEPPARRRDRIPRKSASSLVDKSKRAVVRTSESSLERHERKCVVCHHPKRDEIEELFLHWHQPFDTAYHYKVPVRSLYRHAHTTGLYAARQGNLRSVLDRILEKAERAKVTGDCIVRAVRAYTCLTTDNRWVEPPSRVIFSSRHLPPAVQQSQITSHGSRPLIDTPAIRKRRPDEGRSPERVSRAEGSLSNRHTGD